MDTAPGHLTPSPGLPAGGECPFFGNETMLVQDKSIIDSTRFPILSVMARVNGREFGKEIRAGLYEVGHFGGSHFPGPYDQYPENLSVECYGVCDSPEQLLEKCPEIETSDRGFIVTFHHLKRAEQPKDGGWRWSKWGEYIGEQHPSCEYLADEPKIEEVYIYHIHEKV